MRPPSFRAVLALTVLLASAACATDGVETDQPLQSVSFEDVPIAQVRELPPSGPFVEGRIGPTGGTIFDPSSAALEPAVAYRFSLGHCGLLSPVDLDGSFWDAIDGVTADGQPLDLGNDGEMINATAGVIVVIGDEARFKTDTGSVVRFARHDGEKEFPGCA
jgi:hypothetical protein